MTTIRIEDEDGFATEWPWPDDSTVLHGHKFVAMFEALHDAAREASSESTEANR